MKDDDVPAVDTTEYVKPATTTITQVSSGNNDAGVTTTGQSSTSNAADNWLQDFYTTTGINEGNLDAAAKTYWEGEAAKLGKDKVKDMDMKEDVDALTSGEDLSEEFKAKAATIFEGAVKAKLVEEIEKLESEYETKVDEKVSEVKEEIVDKVDAYLNYVVEEWMKENELAIEKGLRNEITEDFIGGLKSLFESHYICLLYTSDAADE